MRLRTLHEWKVSTQEAIAIQKRLCKEIIQTDAFRYIKKIAGIDVGFEANGRIARAAICIFNYPQLALIEQVLHKQPCTFPYVPGLLSFREAPAILSGLAQIEHQPDLLLCDGQGIAHPRRFGIACHLGLLTDLPSIGVGKSRLIGNHAEPADSRGAWQPLQHQHETIGAVLRTRPHVKPLYISCGHKISLTSAVQWVLNCTHRYKLPEPIRFADNLASKRSGLL